MQITRKQLARNATGDITSVVDYQYASQDEYDGAMFREAFVAAFHAGDQTAAAELVRNRIALAVGGKSDLLAIHSAVLDEAARLNRWLDGAGLPGNVAQVRIREEATAEAIATSPVATITRRTKKLPVVQARLAKRRPLKVQARLADDIGATDSSPSVARITTRDAERIPIDAFVSDLQRKKALRSVMPNPDREGILDELLDDKDDDQNEDVCRDEFGFITDCRHEANASHRRPQRVSERDPRRPSGQLGMRPLGDAHHPEPEPGPGQVSKEDVNYRYDSTGQQPCQSCRNFRGPSGCALVAGLIRATDTCDMFQPIHKAALKVYGR